MLTLIEDSLRMRLNYIIKSEGKTTEEIITTESVANLTEGLSAFSSLRATKRMSSLLKTMIILAHREGRPLLQQDTKLLISVLRLLSDYQVKLGQELYGIIQETI